MPPASPYVPSIIIDQVIQALIEFLQPFAVGLPIVRGQQNRVPMPVTAFLKVQETAVSPIETPISKNDPTNSQALITGPARIDVQVDFYGPNAGDQCKAVLNVYRSPYAPAQFPDGIKPLYCSDGIQAQFVTGEEQYEYHWIITAGVANNKNLIIKI